MTITPTRCHDRDRQNSRRRGAIPRCLNIMRFGYAFMEVGLAIVKRPLLIQDAASLPKEDGLPACVSRNVCHRGKWQDAALLEHEDKDDGDHEDALNRVHDDPHPGALEAPRRMGLKKDALHQGFWHHPRYVQVIEGEQHYVGDPVALPKAARMRGAAAPGRAAPR